MDAIDLGILGITNPATEQFLRPAVGDRDDGIRQRAGPDRAAGVRHERARACRWRRTRSSGASAACALAVTTDRCSNGATLVYPESNRDRAVQIITEAWVLDNFNNDPYAMNAMIDTAENVAMRYQITMAEQHAIVLRRYAQYQDALANDRAFQTPLHGRGADHRRRISARPTGTLAGDEGVFATTAEGLAKLKPVKPERHRHLRRPDPSRRRQCRHDRDDTRARARAGPG